MFEGLRCELFVCQYDMICEEEKESRAEWEGSGLNRRASRNDESGSAERDCTDQRSSRKECLIATAAQSQLPVTRMARSLDLRWLRRALTPHHREATHATGAVGTRAVSILLFRLPCTQLRSRAVFPLQFGWPELGPCCNYESDRPIPTLRISFLLSLSCLSFLVFCVHFLAAFCKTSSKWIMRSATSRGLVPRCSVLLLLGSAISACEVS